MSYESIIQFQKYFISRIDYEMNPEFNKQDTKLEFDLDSKIEVDKENGMAILSVTCEVFPNYVEQCQPFHLAVSLDGLFTFKDKDNPDIEKLLCKNGLAILFPYLRATITTITSTTGLPLLTLPTINVNRYLEKKNKKLEK